jgi:hypothetical protein
VYHSIISLLASMEVCMHLLGATMLSLSVMGFSDQWGRCC